MPKSSGRAKPTIAHDRLKELIVSRVIVPGQKLIYKDLELLLGMSKTPIIHALARLNQENMVEFHHNRGCYVKRWTREEVIQMLALREKVHQIVVDQAVISYSSDNLRALKSALNAYTGYRCEVYDLKKFRLDWAFHIALAKMIDNAYITSILDQQYSILAYCLDLEKLTPLLAKFREDHIRIYVAIAAREPAVAKAALRSHDRASQKFISDRLQSRHSIADMSSPKNAAESGAWYAEPAGTRSRGAKGASRATERRPRPVLKAGRSDGT